MNRFTKYRGIDKLSKKWVYGSLVIDSRNSKKCYIIVNFTVIREDMSPFDMVVCEVITNSVGRFTGHKDYNNVEIYEGDICSDDFSLVQIVFDRMAFRRRYVHDYAAAQGKVKEWVSMMVVSNMYETPHLFNTQKQW